MPRDSAFLLVPYELAKKIAERAKAKDPLKKWSDEAREILRAAVEG